ncbi:type VI secretion system baseplate subunit TssF [Endozoicomonadaceae bacterium StTr2]
MTDSLLHYYARELGFLRKRARQFARAHPDTAEKLGMDEGGVTDPHIERLLEGVAFLNARLHQRLDDSWPQLSDSLLRLLFPLFSRGLPSFALLGVDPDKSLDRIVQLEENQHFEAETPDGEVCTFRSCRPVQLTPLRIEGAALNLAPFRFVPDVPASAMLELSIGGLVGGKGVSDIQCDQLDIQIVAEAAVSRQLHDLIRGKLLDVRAGPGAGDGISLGKSALEPLGLNDNHLLPVTPNTFSGLQRLYEVVAFPVPFLGFRVRGLRRMINRFNPRQMVIYLMLKDAPGSLSRLVEARHFRLNCIPVVNLFDMQAEPLIMDYSRMRERVTPDARAESRLETFSVNSVTEITRHEPVEVPPLYGRRYGDSPGGLYWLETGGRDPWGKLHAYLTMTDIDFNPAINDRKIFAVDITCSNGDLPKSLRHDIELRCIDLHLPGTSRFVYPPTRRKLPSTGYSSSWTLLSLLQFNFESLLVAEEPVEGLRHLIRLCSRGESEALVWLESLSALDIKYMTRPIVIAGRHCHAQGAELGLTLDSRFLGDASVHLLIDVLDQLLAGFSSFNTYTRLSIELKGEPGIYYRCPVRSGRKAGL